MKKLELVDYCPISKDLGGYVRIFQQLQSLQNWLIESLFNRTESFLASECKQIVGKTKPTFGLWIIALGDDIILANFDARSRNDENNFERKCWEIKHVTIEFHHVINMWDWKNKVLGSSWY